MDGTSRRANLDEVHARAGLLGLAAGDFGDRGLAEDLAQGGDTLGPDTPCLVGLLTDLAVEGLDDLQHGDLIGRTGGGVAAFQPTVTSQQSGSPQGRKELLEELLGDRAALGQLLDRNRSLPRAGQLRHRYYRVTRLRSDGNHVVFL